MRILIFLLTCTAVACAEPALQSRPVYGPAQKMTPEEFQRQLAHSKHYDFELASPDGLVDPQGLHIAARDLPAYLAENHLDASAYFLIWITPSTPPLNTVAPTIAPLGNYGATKIVFQHKPDGVAARITGEFKPLNTDPKTEVIFIRPNSQSLVAGEPWPDLSRRPAELRPGTLPPRVRYAFGPDAAMIRAAALLREHLLDASPGGEPLFETTASLQYGIWHQLKNTSALSGHGKPFGGMMRSANGKPLRLEGMLFTDLADIKTIGSLLRDGARTSGPGDIRALSSDEMQRWWPFVAFDYVEPILVLHTKDNAHAYAFLFDHDRVQLVDDLNALPNLAQKEPAAP